MTKLIIAFHNFVNMPKKGTAGKIFDLYSLLKYKGKESSCQISVSYTPKRKTQQMEKHVANCGNINGQLTTSYTSHVSTSTISLLYLVAIIFLQSRTTYKTGTCTDSVEEEQLFQQLGGLFQTLR
jgi:hypothetical protein